ncbi:MAG: hypothetical protein HDR25_06760 [Lachnospiraceae bacterium]|nr:hypothetical protein [Lachnospiraceae bacterium]
MEKSEIRNAIKTVYQELWDVLSLLEETQFFNYVPKGENVTEHSDEDNAKIYFERRIDEIRKHVETLFLEEPKIAKRLKVIIVETKYFITRYEMPGVVPRWKRINPQLLYFDCAFELMEKAPEAYAEICRGLTGIHLACYPDAELIANRKAYFEKIAENNRLNNTEYSEEKAFQDELLNTLTLLFEYAFKEYL